ncbi:hypothetical protein [Acinetobacter seifertii]|uniref:hypothetical protein n=1 Tax=Acinetobacter seifertii TaxID=1530123 RepID=UPI0032B556EE
MKYLPCSRCRGYKKIDVNNIQIDEVVFFYENENKIKLIKGMVVEKLNNFLYIQTINGTFWIEDKNVYPYDAPSQITYNIFGTCFCNHKDN